MGKHRVSAAKPLPHPSILAGTMALLVVLLGVSGVGLNGEGNVQIAGVQATENNEPRVIEGQTPKIVSGPTFSDDDIILPVVDLYRGMCTEMKTLTTVAYNMSITMEEVAGKEGQERTDFWRGSLFGKADKIESAANTLVDITKDSEYVDHIKVEDTAQKARGAAKAFRGYADTLSEDNLTDIANQSRAVAINQGKELTKGVRGITDSSPFPTRATADTVYALPECEGVFVTRAQLNDGETVDAAVDFHNRLQQGIDGVNEARKLLDKVEATSDMRETANAVADAWKSRAEAAEQAEKRMLEWAMPERLTAVELDALRGYEDARKDAAFTWHNLAKSAREQEKLIRESSDEETLNANLDTAANATWDQDVLEEKMIIRVNRVASGGRG